MLKPFFVVILIWLNTALYAQTEMFSGTWQMHAANVPVDIAVKIGAPEKNMLYPAAITIKSGSFYGVYELLLVKKNNWQLFISKNKHAAEEKPFHLDMLPFNGSLDIERNAAGQPVLTIHRLPFKVNSPVQSDSLAATLQKILSSGKMEFTRLNNIPWKDAYTEKILDPSRSPVYFGLADTVLVSTRYCNFSTATLNKIDIASAVLNGHSIFEQWTLTKKERSEELMIDNGNNVLAFFPDYSIKIPDPKAMLRCKFDQQQFNLNFNNPNDSGASFTAAKIVLLQDTDKINSFQYYSYPGPADPPLQSNEKLLGSISSKARQITLAIWDDAVEDGDTISINVNSNIVANHLLIKKAPQFITITLSAGTNTIVFKGENLGSIPPNTAVMEIIDGKNRKAFFLETVPGENNLLKIFYTPPLK